MPSKGTTGRNIRIADDLWQRATEIAKARGETVADVIRRALRDYVDRHEGPAADHPGDDPRL